MSSQHARQAPAAHAAPSQAPPPTYPAATASRTSLAKSPSVAPVNKLIAKPDLYYGDRKQLVEWLTQIDMYLKFQPEIENNNKMLLTSTFIKERAL